eukprot:TRINITY_DN541_c0_g2_i1.p1 TRINITY_DN541_c0_g2~~TRINITY_DN541_c0_g2_i1.p1  ORF type:complete len:456 (+),score=97.82 TRINITY_DN541_c0_g2_i1:77-1444(+)
MLRSIFNLKNFSNCLKNTTTNGFIKINNNNLYNYSRYTINQQITYKINNYENKISNIQPQKRSLMFNRSYQQKTKNINKNNIILNSYFSSTSIKNNDNYNNNTDNDIFYDESENTELFDKINNAIDSNQTTQDHVNINDIISEISSDYPEKWYQYPSAYLEDLLLQVHDFTGIPWWLTLILSTITLRILLLPAVVGGLRASKNLMDARPHLHEIAGKLRSKHLDSKEAREKRKEIYKKYKTHPLKPLIFPVIQIPLFITFFVTLRRMAVTLDSFHYEGAFWFQDLAAVDPMYRLPIICSALMLLQNEISALKIWGVKEKPPTIWIVRVVSVVLLPVSATLIPAIHCYWIGSNISSLLQVLLWRIPKVRQVLKIHEHAGLIIKPQHANTSVNKFEKFIPDKPKEVIDVVPESVTINKDDKTTTINQNQQNNNTKNKKPKKRIIFKSKKGKKGKRKK